MSPSLTLLVAALSDPGLRRENNEDRFLIQGMNGDGSGGSFDLAKGPVLVSVADGMGGAVAGEVASKLAVDTLSSRAAARPSEQSSAEAEAWLVESVREANRRAIQLMQEHTELRGMGSTLTSALVAAGSLALAHVGDSRAYLLHEGQIRRVSVDQTWVGRLVSLGRLTQEQARRHPRRHVLLQAIGTEVEPEIQHLTLDLAAGDRFLLCSDGLTDVVEDAEIEEMLASDVAPAAQCESFVRIANERGGPDNVTVVVGHVTG